jgi:FixJ family two-component response regulator
MHAFDAPQVFSFSELRVPGELPLTAIVDDDDSMREAIKGLLRSLGLAVEVFASPNEFLKSADLDRIACLVADVNMPGMSGLDLYRHLIASGRSIPTILITAYGDERIRERALEAGVLGYLKKPFAEDDLLAHIRSALSKEPKSGRDS